MFPESQYAFSFNKMGILSIIVYLSKRQSERSSPYLLLIIWTITIILRDDEGASISFEQGMYDFDKEVDSEYTGRLSTQNEACQIKLHYNIEEIIMDE